MLPVQNRMRQSSEFRTAMRGSRTARPTLVVHARPLGDEQTHTQSPPTRVGFVVSKAVGNAVTRNRVKRRLRHLVVPLLEQAPSALVVVRALPAAATEPDRLARDLDEAWHRTMRRIVREDSTSRSAATTGTVHHEGAL